MRTLLLPAAILAAAATAGPGCHGSHEYDLTRGPFLALASVSGGSVTIRIADAFPRAVKLRMERRKEGKLNFHRLSPDPQPGDAEYTDATVERGRTYFYRLMAVFPGGRTARSVILKVLAEDLPGAPLSLAASPAPLPPAGARLSFDGSALAWAKEGRALVLDLGTGELRPATRGDLGPEGAPAWTPGGALVLAAGLPGEEALYLVAEDPLAVELLAAPAGGAREPDVDLGGRIAYASGEGLFVLDPATRETILVVPGPVSSPRWGEGPTLTFLDASGTPASRVVR